MGKLTHDSLRRLRAVEESLAHCSIDGDNVEASLEALRDLLRTEKVFLFSLGQRPGEEDLTVTRHACVGFASDRWRSAIDEVLQGRGITCAGYNALRPEPMLRNRVLRSAEVSALTGGLSKEAETHVFSRLGILGQEAMRVLICDGPDTLAFLGFAQPTPTTEEQRDLLERVVPAFRKRLIFDRLMGEAALASSAVIASLEGLNGAAWVLGADGRLAHTNAAGRARFDAAPESTRAALEACVAGTPPPRFKVTALRDRKGAGGYMIVALPDPASPTLGGGVGFAALCIGLTPAQTRVLERVARGSSNATIAAELGVAERTVEAHVTAILVKARVPSRAALIVQVFRELTAA